MSNQSGYIRMRRPLIDGVIREVTDEQYRVLQSIMFNSIWEERDHKCAVSDKPLTMDARTYYFHHILEKRSYEEYALCKWNIIILDYDVHNKYEVKADSIPFLVELRSYLLSCIEVGYQFDNDSIWYPGLDIPDHLSSILGKVSESDTPIIAN